MLVLLHASGVSEGQERSNLPRLPPWDREGEGAPLGTFFPTTTTPRRDTRPTKGAVEPSSPPSMTSVLQKHLWALPCRRGA
jgi:hypothetical protein